MKDLIFDIGNVLISYRYHDMLADFGMSDELIEPLSMKIFADDKWPKFDAGEITKDELMNIYIQEMPEYAYYARRFFNEAEKMVLPRPNVYEKVYKLKKLGYKIYLLSNYSEYMYMKHTDIIPFRDDVDGKVISYEIGKLKPSHDIYKHLLDKYNLTASNCIFMDDMPKNVKAATELGMEGHVITSENNVLEILDRIIEEQP